MKIAGSYPLTAPRDRVWPIIFDPAALLDLIPGCDQIESDGPGLYRGTVTLRVPAVSGAYRMAIKILDQRAPEFCRLDGEAAGSAGSVRGQAEFILQEADGGTLVQYDGDAIISGPLAGMNSRFVEGVAQQLIRQGLRRLDAQAAAAMAADAAAAPERVERLGLWPRFVAWLRLAVRRVLGRQGPA
jgi:carbon monoxide dehydrogenase subunit G